MRTNWHKALLVSFVLITSSLAGCLDTDDDDDEKLEGKYGTVMVSTYHIEQMVSAIVGDTVNVEMLSTNNIPVHDYSPTQEDIIRLSESDLFLYHGLGLETWVEDAMDSLGSDAPEYASTHTMPTGEVNLDYESMLINDLCKLLAGGPYESLHLSFDEDDVSEIHAEPVTHTLVAAEHDEDEHDDHDEDEHDNHDEDEHDDHGDHDGHEGHGHTEAEEMITNPEGCPADSVIQVFHLEEGEYVIEFESEHHDDEFDLAVLKMLGGHAHHDHHGHDDEDSHEEGEHEEFEVVFYHMNGCSMCESIMPEWDSFVEDNPDITTRKVESGESEASEMNIASYPTILMLDDGQMVAEFDEDYNAENLEHFYEEHAGHEEENPESEDYTGLFIPVSATFSGFEVTDSGMTFSGMLNIDDAPFGAMEVYTNSDMDITGFNLMDVENENNWVKFRLLDSGEISIDESIEQHALPFMLMDMNEFEDDDDEMVCYDIETHTIVDIYDEDECTYAGYMWTSMDRGDDDDRDGEMVCHDMSTHTNDYSIDNQEDCEDSGGIWIADEGHDDHDEDMTQEECELRDGTWEELPDSSGEYYCDFGHGEHDEDRDDMEDMYYKCLPFVPYSADGFSGFDDSNLDDSSCGEMIVHPQYHIEETGLFTMPEHLIFQDCWMEDNETVCHEAEITYNSDNGELWESYSEEEYMDCDGDYDNDTGICVNWIGNVTASNATAFIVYDEEVEILVHYQYDSELMSGYLIVPTEPESVDLSMTFDMLDADDDGEVTLSEWADFANESDDDEPMSDEDIERLSMMMDMYDDDDSGGLNYTEFVNLMEGMDRDYDDDPEFMFNMFDTNNDGEVTLTEWVEAANNSEDGDPMTDEDIEGLSMMMDMHDDDDSGGLDFDEFINMMNSMDDDTRDDPELVFYMLDADGDGEVTLSEWVDFANESANESEFTLPMTDEDIEGLSMMMDMYDDDNSGGLDLEEFINMMEEMDSHDDDHDSLQVLVVYGMEGIGGSLDDYSLTLANCDDLDEDENLNDLDCSADIWSMTLSDIQVTEDEIMTSGLSIMYMDSDSSNSLTIGDIIMIDHSTLDVDEDWNTARLYSEEADSYSDENPMLPGFTGILATIGLLGAALIRRD